jgi:ribosomal protein S18 acetylase RimI-like enzyme
MLVRLAADAADHAGAVAVWQRATISRGRPPDEARIERVRTKLAEPDALVLVAVDDEAVDGDPVDGDAVDGDAVDGDAVDRDAVVGDAVAGTVVGMVLAEPGRYDDGTGERDPVLCHVSMVFVAPDRWRTGVGGALMAALAERAAAAGYRRMQVWTRASNHAAAGLYRRHGFRATGRTALLPDGEPILHHETA